jgi:DNA-binding transcriptional regulator/RsmH inhibitor MraZ
LQSLKGAVVLAGVADRVELWDENMWQDYKAKIEKGAEGMAQTLGELGML